MQCSQSVIGILCIAAAFFLWGVSAEAAQLSWLCGADVLLKLVQERGFEMFVHPIAPVLNETRHVVAPFNHKLQQQVHPPLLSTDCETCHCPVLPLCLRLLLSKTASLSASSRVKPMRLESFHEVEQNLPCMFAQTKAF